VDVILKFLLVIALMQLAYIVGLLTSCWVQRLPIRRIDIFQWGPCLYRGMIGETEICVATVPFGAAVTIVGMIPDEFDIPGGFAKRGRLGRAAVHLTSVLALILVGVWACGGDTAINLIWTGPQQIIAGAWSPLSIGKEHVLRFFDLLDNGPLYSAVGVVSLKYAALCLLPIPQQNLFQAIVELCLPGNKRHSFPISIFTIGLVLNICIFASWFVAIVAACIERSRGEKPEIWIIAAVSLVALLVSLSNRDRALHPKPAAESEKKSVELPD